MTVLVVLAVAWWSDLRHRYTSRSFYNVHTQTSVLSQSHTITMRYLHSVPYKIG